MKYVFVYFGKGIDSLYSGYNSNFIPRIKDTLVYGEEKLRVTSVLFSPLEEDLRIECVSRPEDRTKETVSNLKGLGFLTHEEIYKE